MANNAVRFVYLAAGRPLPVPADPNAIYFVEEAQQIWVGDKLLADRVNMDPYQVKSLVVDGEGSIISDVIFDADTGVITVTKGNPPAITIGPDGPIPSVTPDSDNQLEVVTGVSVEGHVLSLEKTKIAFENYMTTASGTAVDATVSLKQDPTDPMDAATKQYVDDAVAGLTGAMHLLGISSTKIVNGERNIPTIDGRQMEIEGIRNGDVVLYSPGNNNNYLEFVWTGSNWKQLGDESSYALKDTQIIAGNGLSGGGSLASDVTISMEQLAEETTEHKGSKSTEVIYSVTTDEYGRVLDAKVLDIKPIIDAAIADATIDPGGGSAVTDLIEAAKQEAIAAAKEYTDQAIQSVVGIDVVIMGTGSAVIDASYDADTHTLTFYKGDVEEQGDDEHWSVVPSH